ncbi:MAG: hypothetical protein Ct9H300mP18_09160 [Candidatus Neomarinimicrobiota bacterium]|nr:MAG: hypothetical protein Ct9H300mP18_09160 [Candidatus Neomarinimicrobiota bacterium]
MNFLKNGPILNFPGNNLENTKSDDISFQLQDLVNAYSFYKKIKAENNALVFGDMILGCYKFTQKCKSFLRQVRKEYKHIFMMNIRTITTHLIKL